MDIKDRYLGCLVGLAYGDALGTTAEFSKPGFFEPYYDLTLVGDGHFRLNPGEWTDDTSMTLCLAASLIECGWDTKDQMNRYVKWFREGYMSSTGRCFDIGGTTLNSLQEYWNTGNPTAGPTDQKSAGNGSLMRLAPIPMVYRSDLSNAAWMARESSKTTHGAEECLEACDLFCCMVVDALNGKDKFDILDKSNRYFVMPKIKSIVAGFYREKDASEISASGYVIHTLEAVLWAFANSSSFEEGMLKVVNLGEDSDTTGAIYGMLAGAFYGIDAMPKEEVDKLAKIELIKDYALKLYDISEKL